MHVYHVHAWYPWKPEENTGSIGAGITGGCELPWGCWELNSGPLQVQQVLSCSWSAWRNFGEENQIVHDGDVITKGRERQVEMRRSRETCEQGMSLAPSLHGSNKARSCGVLELKMVSLVHLPHPLQRTQENSFNLRMSNKTGLWSSSVLLLWAGKKKKTKLQTNILTAKSCPQHRWKL